MLICWWIGMALSSSWLSIRVGHCLHRAIQFRWHFPFFWACGALVFCVHWSRGLDLSGSQFFFLHIRWPDGFVSFSVFFGVGWMRVWSALLGAVNFCISDVPSYLAPPFFQELCNLRLGRFLLVEWGFGHFFSWILINMFSFDNFTSGFMGWHPCPVICLTVVVASSFSVLGPVISSLHLKDGWSSSLGFHLETGTLVISGNLALPCFGGGSACLLLSSFAFLVSLSWTWLSIFSSEGLFSAAIMALLKYTVSSFGLVVLASFPSSEVGCLALSSFVSRVSICSFVSIPPNSLRDIVERGFCFNRCFPLLVSFQSSLFLCAQGTSWLAGSMILCQPVKLVSHVLLG